MLARGGVDVMLGFVLLEILGKVLMDWKEMLFSNVDHKLWSWVRTERKKSKQQSFVAKADTSNNIFEEIT